MDPVDLEPKLTPKTRAIVIQHTFGIPARMDELLAVARRHSIPIIEDCCHTHGSIYGDAIVGSFGVGAFYSFEWGKPLVVGVGGSAIVNDSALRATVRAAYAEYQPPSLLRVLRVQAQYMMFDILYRPSRYWRLRSAFRALARFGVAESNYHAPGSGLSPEFHQRMAGSLRRRLVRKAASHREDVAHAQELAGIYSSQIRGKDVRQPEIPPCGRAIFARYPLRVPNKAELLEHARASNIELADWYTSPVHPLSKVEWKHVAYSAGSCHRAEQLATEVVSLPTHTRATSKTADRAVAFFEKEYS
jgi:dTDP-4-amino-4,6-dideoxygalactose transaminase